jgi:diamine N-acetyltransferase
MNENTIEWPVLRLYDLISGPADEERDWDAVRELFWPGARLRMALREEDGSERVLDVTVDQFAEQAAEHYRQSGFWERELTRKVDRFGGAGHVFSTYETRRGDPESAPVARGINSVQMFRRDECWKIASIVFHIERPQTPIPIRYLANLGESGTAPDHMSTVSLREIDGETVRTICQLSVSDEQQTFVAPNAVSLAQASVTKSAWFRAIYAGETPVGFIMLEDQPEKPEYFLWRLMIDTRYQGMGFGERALEQLIEYVKTRHGATELLTSFAPGEGGPQGFYEKLGFEPTGGYDDGETIMRLRL